LSESSTHIHWNEQSRALHGGTTLLEATGKHFTHQPDKCRDQYALELELRNTQKLEEHSKDSSALSGPGLLHDMLDIFVF